MQMIDCIFCLICTTMRSIEDKPQDKITRLLNYFRKQYPEARNDVNALQQAVNRYAQDQIKGYQENRSYLNIPTQELTSIIQKIKKIIKAAVKEVRSQSMESLYNQYKNLVKPILHNHHNGHQQPFHEMHIHSTHMKWKLIQELKKETDDRKKSEENLENLYAGMKLALLRKQGQIKELQGKLREATLRVSKEIILIQEQAPSRNRCLEGNQQKQTLIVQPNNTENLLRVKQKLIEPAIRQQGFQHGQFNTIFAGTFAKQPIQPKIPKTEYPYLQIDELLIEQTDQNQIQDQSNHLSPFHNNFNRSNESEGWMQPSIPNLTNLDVQNSATAEEERKSRSYFKPKPGQSSAKTDQLWRILLVQAGSIDDFIGQAERARKYVS